MMEAEEPSDLIGRLKAYTEQLESLTMGLRDLTKKVEEQAEEQLHE